MARVSSKDPLDKFRWIVEIDGFVKLGFASCEVPSVSINAQAYPEGGAHLFPRKIVDSIEYKPVSLQRGVTANSDFHKWATQHMEFVTGFKLINNPDGTQDKVDSDNYRKDIKIHHVDRAGRKIKTYTLYQAFPIEYKPASDFDASADDGISMERLVLTYESFSVDVMDGAESQPSPFDPSDILKRVVKRL